MPGDVMGIGEFGAAVGLSVSALRFYDRSHVLTPADVDPRTGYRRYGTEQMESGLLVARLRRIGVGVSELRLLVTDDPDVQVISDVLDRHLQRLENGLADARQELDRIRSTLTHTPEASSSVSDVRTVLDVVADDLLRAFDAVWFSLPALDTEPELQMIACELAGDMLSLYTTDRYRLASCSVPALVRAGDSTASFAIPTHAASRLRGNTFFDETVQLELTSSTLNLMDKGSGDSLPLFDGVVPDLRAVMEPRVEASELASHSSDLLSDLFAHVRAVSEPDGTTVSVAYVAEDRERPGHLAVVPPEVAKLTAAVAVNADYLTDALRAGPPGAVTLTLQGMNPLAIRFGEDPSTTSLLMPRRA